MPPGPLTEALEAWNYHQLGLGKLQEEPVGGNNWEFHVEHMEFEMC